MKKAISLILATLVVFGLAVLPQATARAATVTISTSANWSAIASGSGPAGQPNGTDTIVVNNGATLTVDVPIATVGSLQLGDSGGTGALNMSGGGTLQIAGAFDMFSGLGATFTPGAGTVEYNGPTDQTIENTTYNNLVISGGGVNTFTLAVTALGNLTINPGATLKNGPSLSVGGNFTNSGSFDAMSRAPLSVVSFNGAGAQTLTGVSNFYDLQILNAAGLNITSDVLVNNELSLTNGHISTGAFKVVVPTAGFVSRTGGYVVGNLQKTLPAGAGVGVTFELGTPNGYDPVSVVFDSVTTAGNLIARTTALPHPSLSSSSIDPARDASLYWTLANAGMGFSGNYSATLNFNATDLTVSANATGFIVGEFNGGWTYPTVGAKTAFSTQATGLTTFGDFAVGNQVGASKLAFTTQPVGGTAGSSLGTQPVVTVQDFTGNTVLTSTASITLAIGTNPGAGTMSGTATATAVNGVATFTGLSIDKSGTGYTLTANSTGLTAATSNPFNITAGAASKLGFTAQPGGATAGAAFADQPVVAVQDALGNTVTTSTANVTLAISTNPPGTGVLSGTTSVNAVNGLATFTDLRIDQAGQGYILSASSTGLTTSNSAPFNVSSLTPTQLGFVTQPAGALAGVAFTTQPSVAVQDVLGNTITTASANVTLAIASNPPGNGVLSGTATVTTVNGVATFGGLSIDKPGTGYILSANTTGGLTSANSTAFTVSGPATKLAFTTQPSVSNDAGAAFGTQPVVTVQDAAGNAVTSSVAPVTIAIGNNPGGGTLSGTATVNAVDGVATFSGLSINRPGVNYNVVATSGLLSQATSANFTVVVGPASKLAFTTQPSSSSAAGAIFATQPVVVVQDAGGNTVTGSTANVTLAIGTNPSGGTLSGTVSMNASSGVASFSGLIVGQPGAGYTLVANSGSLAQATSAAFNVFGTAAKLAFTTQPAGAAPGASLSAQPVVAVQDSLGITVTTSAANVTMAIGTNPANGTLGGATTVTSVNGVAAFAGLSINLAGTGYTLTASSVGLTSANSTAFNITNPPPAGGGGFGGGGGGGGGGSYAVNLTGLNMIQIFVNGLGNASQAYQLTSQDGKFSLSIASGTQLLNSAGSRLTDLAVAAAASPASGGVSNAVLMSYDITPPGATFTPAITMTFNYGGVTLPVGVSESGLYIGWWNGAGWQALASTVNSAGKTVTTSAVLHLTQFALLGALPAPTTTAPPVTTPPTTTTPATTAPTTTPPATTAPTTSPAITSTPAPTTNPSGVSSSAWMIVALILGAIVVVGAVVMVVGRNRRKK